MLKVTVYTDAEHRFTGFDTEGHAEYADEGEDILCAAASVLVLNTLNSIEAFTEDETSCSSDEEQGQIQFRFLGIPSPESRLLMQSMLLGLQNLEDNSEYAPYIDIIFREV